MWLTTFIYCKLLFNLLTSSSCENCLALKSGEQRLLLNPQWTLKLICSRKCIWCLNLCNLMGKMQNGFIYGYEFDIKKGWKKITIYDKSHIQFLGGLGNLRWIILPSICWCCTQCVWVSTFRKYSQFICAVM